MLGYVLNLEKLDENRECIATIPLYASKSKNTIVRKLREIKDEWRNDIIRYGWEGDIHSYGDQIVIDGDVDNNYGSVGSRYIIENIEII